MASNGHENTVWRVRTVGKTMKEDLKSVMALAKAENWLDNFNEYDLVCDLDPACWLVAENDAGEIVGHCVALPVSPGVVGVGCYVVSEAWRGRGVGRSLWRAMQDHVGEVAFVLGTADHNKSMYAGRGFQLLYRLIIVGGPLDKENEANVDSASQPPDDVIIMAPDESLAEQLCRYDARVNAGTSREDLILKWILNNEACHPLVALNHAHDVIGYGALHHATHQRKQWYVSPLYADSADVARRIFQCLLDWVPDGEKLIMFIPDDAANPQALQLCLEAGLAEVYRRNIVATNAEDVKDKLLLGSVFALSTTCMMAYV